MLVADRNRPLTELEAGAESRVHDIDTDVPAGYSSDWVRSVTC